MSLYKDASLAMIPSAYKDGKLYSIRPTDGSGDFTFSRGSNLAATRVASSGYIEKGRENLLLQSNQFDTTWSSIDTTETSGQSGYDGSSNAWLLSKSASSARIQQSISTSGVQTYSVYVKAGTLNYVMLNNSLVSQWFDLSNGTIGTNSSSVNTIDANMEDVGGGWYRCSLTFPSTIPIVRIYPSQADGDVSGTSGNIYIQDAQLEQGLVATDYIETGATTAQAGILEDLPRIDYSGGASCPALLLEPQRTNEFSFSEYASGNTLTGSPIITENYAISPDGRNNAFRIQDTTGGTYKRIAEAFSVSANSTYTQSIFVKKATSAVSAYGGIGFDYSGGTRQISYIIFDEYNGTMTALQSQSTLTLHDAEDFGDYWRFSISAEDTGSNTYISINIYACLSANGISVTAGIKEFIAYGLQLEQGSYPTSYIPTYGSSVTRGSDYMDVTPTNLLGSTTGSWFMELDDMTFEITGTSVPTIYLGDDTNNCLALEAIASGQNKTIYLVKEESSTVTALDSFTISGKTKICFVWDGTTLKVFRDGVQRYSATSFTQPTNWDTFVYNHSSRVAFSEINSVILFPTALTDQEAIDLTTL